MTVPVDLDGDGVSTYGEQWVFNDWLAAGGSLDVALAHAALCGETLDLADFFAGAQAALSREAPLAVNPGKGTTCGEIAGSLAVAGGGAGGQMCPDAVLPDDPCFTRRIPPSVSPNSFSSDARISADGTFIVFRTAADLGSGSNGFHQIYRFNRHQGGTGSITLASVVNDPNPQNPPQLSAAHCFRPAVSDDGQMIVFETTAALDPLRDTNLLSDIYVRDLRASPPATRLLSRSEANGMSANGTSRFASISGDGNVVAYTSSATDLTTDPVTGLDNVYRVGTNPDDPLNLPTELVSVSDNLPAIANAPMRTTDPAVGTVGAVLNFAGDRCVFEGAPTNWTGVTGNLGSGGIEQIYCRDLAVAPPRTHMISRSLTDLFTPGNGASRRASISAFVNPDIPGGGERIVWSSTARNLEDPPATDSFEDVFISLLLPSIIAPFKVSVGLGGQTPNGHSRLPMVNDNGRLVAFESVASNLVAADTNGRIDIFVRDRLNEPGFVIRRFSVNPAVEPPQEGNNHSRNPGMTGDGRVVVYQSLATNLIASDSNGVQDVFETLSPQGPFIRGDANGSGGVNSSDGSFINNWLFLGGPRPGCLDAADANDDGGIDLTDSVYILNFLFIGGPPPPCPHPCCGEDPTPDALTCAVPLTACMACQ